MNLFRTKIKKVIYRTSLGSMILLLTAANPMNAATTSNASIVVCEEMGTGFATVESYIARYKHIAIEEMQNVGIPASIKLAQAILESSYGNSELAVEANNHFGIKCGSSWTGLSTRKDDDAPNECFRKYRNSYESYIDHSQFLEQPRYAALFNISITDYKSWARGLTAAGYATNPNYANMLIEIIERHELYKIDQEQVEQEVVLVTNTNPVSPVESSRQFEKTSVKEASTAVNRKTEVNKTASGRIAMTEPLYYNGIKTIVLESPATARQVEMLYGINADKVCLYNNVAPNEVIPANTKIYLQPMRNKGAKNMVAHTVASGETMEEISQYYGVKLSKLYKRNKMDVGRQPAAGQVVYLRGKASYTPLSRNNELYETPIEYKTKSKSKVIIADKPAYNPTEVTSQPATTSRDYYDTSSSSNNKSNNTETITYFNEEKSTGYGNYQPVKDKVSSVVNSVKEMVTGESQPVTTKTVEPEVKTYYTQNNDGKVYGENRSNVVVSQPTTTYYNSSNTNSTYSVNSNEGYTVFDEPVITESTPVTTYTTTPVTTNNSYVTTYETTSQPASQTVTHTVVKGDTLYNISKRHNTTVEQIKQLNNLDNNTIKLGQRLNVLTNTQY